MIVREPGRDRWLVLDQAVIRNPQLSHRAKGILALLLSMPDGWQANSDWIAKHGAEGRDAVRNALRELEQAGHMIREVRQDERGHWHSRWVVYEQPVQRHVDKHTTEAGFPVVGFPGPIRSTKEEVLTHKTTDMVREQPKPLCTTCQGTGRTVPTYTTVVEQCPTCGGDGLGKDRN